MNRRMHVQSIISSCVCIFCLTFRRTLDHDRRIFNYRLSRARRIVENAFGRLAAIWQIFKTTIYLQPEKADSIVMACCALHNFVLHHRTLSFTTDPDAYIRDGTWRTMRRAGLRPIQHRQAGNKELDAKAVRDSRKRISDLRLLISFHLKGKSLN